MPYYRVSLVSFRGVNKNGAKGSRASNTGSLVWGRRSTRTGSSALGAGRLDGCGSARKLDARHHIITHI